MIETKLRPYPAESLEDTDPNARSWVVNESEDNSAKHYQRLWFAVLPYWAGLATWNEVETWSRL